MTEKYKVLVVDDNEINLKNAVEAIEELGHDVVSASSAKEAIEIIEEISKNDDLFMVLSDMNMEHQESGIDVLDFCNSRCIPCIIVTGGLDHGRPAVSIQISPHFPVFSEFKTLMAIKGIVSYEKNKEVWKEAANSFLSYWDRVGRGMDVVNYVEWVFQIRKEYRIQKGDAIKREEQFSFKAGIMPEMTKEFYQKKERKEKK